VAKRIGEAIGRCALVGLGLMTALAFVEIGLRTTRLSERESASVTQVMPDSQLRVRLRPGTGGHDARGFRNETAAGHADIVAIGDSVTYGYNVTRDHAWPQALARLGGSRVYNMGVGGYGPVQYALLVSEAQALSPATIVIALYMGNDLADAYRMVYGSETHAHLRAPYAAPELFVDTIGPKAESFTFQLSQFLFERRQIWRRTAIARFLDDRGLAPGMSLRDRASASVAWARAYPELGTVVEVGTERTVVTPGYHLLGLDLTDPRIREGLRITKELVAQTRDRVAGMPATLGLLLIPTKEQVYSQHVRGTAPNGLTTEYEALLVMENQVFGELLELCSALEIMCVDARRALVTAARDGEVLYPPTTDGHFVARGYELLAQEVAVTLGRAH
jgi:hypothetical protein